MTNFLRKKSTHFHENCTLSCMHTTQSCRKA